MADMINTEIGSLVDFYKESKHFINKCEKPTFEEFTRVGVSTAVGFGVIGFIGFFVKLIFIPINNVIIGA